MKIRKFALLMLCVSALLVILASSSCTRERKPAYPLEITDGVGRIVSIPREPERIVCLTPSSAEIVFAVGAGSRVVGISEDTKYPVEAQEITKIGSYTSLNIEKITALDPDLLFADPYQESAVERLESLGLAVVILDYKSIEQILSNIALTGKVIGQEKEASSVVKNIEAKIGEIAAKTAHLKETERPKVLYLYEPIWVAGSDTLANSYIEKAGGINVAADIQECQSMNLEAVITRNPDVILCVEGYAPTLDWVMNEPRLQEVNALKNNRVYPLDADTVDCPGPRIGVALELVAKCLYPELFGAASD
jgi:iron complex transport system substrate-binding protein